MNTPEGSIVSRLPSLTTTTYGVLGLLAVRPYSTYELTKAMGLSVGRLWPRAESKLFEEPKKLVEHGYARASAEHVGRRPRTVYSITPSGRRALADWLAEPGAGPSVEFEGLVKLLFAEFGTKHDALGTIARVRDWAVEANDESVAAGRRFAERGGRYEQRHGRAMLMGAFLTDFYALVARWADWAAEEVASWPEDIASHRIEPAAAQAVLDRAGWSSPPH